MSERAEPAPLRPIADGRTALNKLEVARTHLILERPFIGALLMHLPLIANRRCARIATDARALYFNPAYIEAISFADAHFMLAHDALHCALLHFYRRGHRVAFRPGAARHR